MSTPYVKWYEEEVDGPHGGQRVHAAWLVRDLQIQAGESDSGGQPGSVRQQMLAYLGQHPAVTPVLREDLEALYPEIQFDWDGLVKAIAGRPGVTNIAALTDDELALSLTALAQERGLAPMDLSLRLGYRERQILPELLTLLRDPSVVARLERTSGSVIDYLVQKHPEYAFLIYKARLYFEGDERTLDTTVEAEPQGFSGEAWQARRLFWQSQLEAYRARRSAPDFSD
ncbi:MAG TPA: hypothetical protein VNM48_21160 [Chloroflexota bacterium]|nr:hypothetical protein [Chloroflexota bacterium]